MHRANMLGFFQVLRLEVWAPNMGPLAFLGTLKGTYRISGLRAHGFVESVGFLWQLLKIMLPKPVIMIGGHRPLYFPCKNRGSLGNIPRGALDHLQNGPALNPKLHPYIVP